jgi:trimethylamine--corrinoid protein Co-methyltransferase
VRPSVVLLHTELTDRIIDEARETLQRIGVDVRHRGAVEALASAGARVEGTRVRLPGALLDAALSTTPGVVRLFDAKGRETHDFSGLNVHFTPGSSALLLVDGATGECRRPTTTDYVQYVKVVSRLRHLAAQSTAMIPADVPDEIADSYRLYLGLRYSDKPVVTGAFSAEGFVVMRDLLVAVRGTASALRDQPLAMFTCCPTSPLAWGEAACHNLVDCAQAGIPVEIVPMPLAGMTAPVTPIGALAQHTAEALSGIAIAQAVNPGAPVLFGSSIGVLDVRTTTTPLGAVESMMLGCAAAEIGRRLGVPTQAYMILSDAKLLDAQCGLESGVGATLGALCGINSISGPGMIDFQSGFSLEKLIVDHEICGMVRQLLRGLTVHEDLPVAPLLDELIRDKHLVIADHTRRHLRDAIAFPRPVIDRDARARWEEGGRTTIAERARREIAAHLREYEPPSRPETSSRALEQVMAEAARAHGLDVLR